MRIGGDKPVFSSIVDAQAFKRSRESEIRLEDIRNEKSTKKTSLSYLWCECDETKFLHEGAKELWNRNMKRL